MNDSATVQPRARTCLGGTWYYSRVGSTGHSKLGHRDFRGGGLLSEIRPRENKALFPAHRVTKMNIMRAAAKIFLEIDVVKNSLFYFLGQIRGVEFEFT